MGLAFVIANHLFGVRRLVAAFHFVTESLSQEQYKFNTKAANNKAALPREKAVTSHSTPNGSRRIAGKLAAHRYLIFHRVQHLLILASGHAVDS
jgi:hypothetical protein